MGKALIAGLALLVGTGGVTVGLPAFMPPPAMTAPLGAARIGQPGSPFGSACQPVVTQPYGPTALVGEPTIEGRLFHTGIDLACPLGTPIHSLTAGVARVVTGWSADSCCVKVGGGFGNSVVVETTMSLGGEPPQRYFIRYAHLLGEIAVSDGQAVAAGDLLGFEGSSGFATGPHLHFEIDRGAPRVEASIDPSALLALS